MVELQTCQVSRISRETPVIYSIQTVIINRIEYKLLSLTYKVLTTSQPDYLRNLIAVQSTGIELAPRLLSP